MVVLPSSWEGFGNPTIESVVHRRPLAVGPYPVAAELAAFGFDWFALSEMGRLRAWLASPDPTLLDGNLAVASAHFSMRDLPDRIACRSCRRSDARPVEARIGAGTAEYHDRHERSTRHGHRPERRPGSRPAVQGGRRLTADARRRQLFEVALSLFAEHGYAATTMDDIAESAGVTKPLVYQHFESKRALYLELMDVVSHELVTRIVTATAAAAGPRQQVELGFSAYFELMVDNEPAFRLLYGRDAPDDPELGAALRRVEETIAQAIDPLIDAGLDPEHRLLLAHAVVGMAEGASRHWLDRNRREGGRHVGAADPQPASADVRRAEAARLATRLADFAWAGLRQVHRI